MRTRDQAVILRFAVGAGLGGPIIGAVLFRVLFAIFERPRSWASIAMALPVIGLPEMMAVVLFSPIAAALGGFGAWLLLRHRPSARLHVTGAFYGASLGLSCPPLAALTNFALRSLIGFELPSQTGLGDAVTSGFGPYSLLFEVTAVITGGLVGWITGRKIGALPIDR
jgi:hypothetical protein